MTDEILKLIGERIRENRLAMRLTPKELADDIGRDPFFIAQLEAGSIDVDIETLNKCAVLLGMSVSDLLESADVRQKSG